MEILHSVQGAVKIVHGAVDLIAGAIGVREIKRLLEEPGHVFDRMCRNLLVEILAKGLTVFYQGSVVEAICNGETNRFIACGSSLPSWLGHWLWPPEPSASILLDANLGGTRFSGCVMLENQTPEPYFDPENKRSL